MGLSTSLQSSDPFMPLNVRIAADDSKRKSKMKKSQKLYEPIIDEKIRKIEGSLISGTLAQIKAENKIASYFKISHAYVVFGFSCLSQVRCEISGYEGGTAIFINKVEHFSADLEETFECSTNGLTVQKIIDWTLDYYDLSGDYHVLDRNCYDYVSFMLQQDFPGAYEATKKWKQCQIEKVPCIFRK